MSRIGKKPIDVPANVKVKLDGGAVAVEGPKGKLDFKAPASIAVKQEGGKLICERKDELRQTRALHGLTRSLLQNMITGVTVGFQRKLEIVGVGFVANIRGKALGLTVGYSNEVLVPIPEGLKVELPSVNQIVVSGANKQVVGQFAAEVRAARKPEPYKGTGIRYEGEQVRRKAGKAFGSGG